VKAFLMHRDRDFDLLRELPPSEQALTQDLELNTLFAAMAAGDGFLFEVAKRALLLSLDDPEEIVYRQQILTDCLENASVVRELYALAGAAIQAEKRVWSSMLRDSPRSMLGSSVQKMELLIGFLRQLRELTDLHADQFGSPGLTRFFAMLIEELDDEYFELLEGHLKALKFKGGMLLSAQLTAGNKGAGYTLRCPREQSLLERMFDRSGYSFTIPDRDDNGFRALGELEDRGVNLVANALAQSLDHVRSFFVMLRIEIGFYVACVNLSDRLGDKGEPITFPEALPAEHVALSAQGLYDVCLTLTIEQRAVGNDVDADGKSLVLITGANQGGKSTFLRSVGLAQLMSQSGMFVGGQSFHANVCEGIFTHYKREEDETMESGKLDEELARMSEIAGHLAPNSVLLCNESFAATNEREGSEIARQVIHALLAERIKVLFVTHMFDLANSFCSEGLDTALFLRAQRNPDGTRSFKLAEGKPLPTSYGEDSYRKIFGMSIDARAASLPDSSGS
jgi:DNA mismatch repair ATPase MutS